MTLEFALIVALAVATFAAGYIVGFGRGFLKGLNTYQIGVHQLIKFGALVRPSDAAAKAKLAGLDKFYANSIATTDNTITGIG